MALLCFKTHCLFWYMSKAMSHLIGVEDVSWIIIPSRWLQLIICPGVCWLFPGCPSFTTQCSVDDVVAFLEVMKLAFAATAVFYSQSSGNFCEFFLHDRLTHRRISWPGIVEPLEECLIDSFKFPCSRLIFTDISFPTTMCISVFLSVLQNVSQCWRRHTDFLCNCFRFFVGFSSTTAINSIFLFIERAVSTLQLTRKYCFWVIPQWSYRVPFCAKILMDESHWQVH